MDRYTCVCTVWEYITDYEECIHNTYNINKYIEARDEYHAQELLLEWVYNIWPDADVDNIEIW